MSIRALTCDDHGFGGRREECVICSRYANNPAFLCDNCRFYAERRECCVCGHWPANNLAMVCDEHCEICVRCGNRF
ncbi:MAG: hypothetical protein N2643_00360 [Endomicrobia bacterium]|nr:hypothetical protein [Endomicrobiia bacterium]